MLPPLVETFLKVGAVLTFVGLFVIIGALLFCLIRS